MEKRHHATTVIVVLGLIAILGPMLGSKSMSEASVGTIPSGYLYVLAVWVALILSCYIVIQRSKW